MKAFQLLFVAYFAFSLLGCNRPPEASSGGNTATESSVAEDHQHPQTLQEGFDELTKLHAAIKSAFESGDPELAHEELHEVTHLLDEGFSEIIDQHATLDAEAKTSLTTLLSELFDQFSKLDDHVHDGGGVTFSEVDQVITAKLDELKKLIP